MQTQCSYGMTPELHRKCELLDTPLTKRRLVHLLEREMLKHEQVECPVVHIFAKGVYVRQLHVRAGILSTGKIHKYEHVGMLLKGVRDMVIDGEVRTVKAPFTTIVKAGEKLACYTWEDSIYATVHPNPDDERDIATLERRYVCDTEEEYAAFLKYGTRLEDCRRGYRELTG